MARRTAQTITAVGFRLTFCGPPQPSVCRYQADRIAPVHRAYSSGAESLLLTSPLRLSSGLALLLLGERMACLCSETSPRPRRRGISRARTAYTPVGPLHVVEVISKTGRQENQICHSLRYGPCNESPGFPGDIARYTHFQGFWGHAAIDGIILVVGREERQPQAGVSGVAGADHGGGPPGGAAVVGSHRTSPPEVGAA